MPTIPPQLMKSGRVPVDVAVATALIDRAPFRGAINRASTVFGESGLVRELRNQAGSLRKYVRNIQCMAEAEGHSYALAKFNVDQAAARAAGSIREQASDNPDLLARGALAYLAAREAVGNLLQFRDAGKLPEEGTTRPEENPGDPVYH